jgi:hypothetical protein
MSEKQLENDKAHKKDEKKKVRADVSMREEDEGCFMGL